MVEEKKPWYKSKGKVGGVLIGLAGVFAVAGESLTGGNMNPELLTRAVQSLMLFGGALGVWGVRAKQDK